MVCGIVSHSYQERAWASSVNSDYAYGNQTLQERPGRAAAAERKIGDGHTVDNPQILSPISRLGISPQVMNSPL